MRLAVLGSGSSGNAVVVESAGKRLLVDAGFSRRQIELRLRKVQEAAGDVTPAEDPRYVQPDVRFDAMVLTHEHGDHVAGVEVLARRTGVHVWATRGTLEGTRLSDRARQQSHFLRSGEPREIAGFQVEPFSVPHDAREPVGFIIEDAAGRRVGLVADLGARTRLAWSKLRDLDTLILETNHDLQMLRNGPYPWSLKQRVASRHGHLSNADATQGILEALQDTGDRLQTVVCYHLSRTNNDPELAAASVGEMLERESSTARVIITHQDQPTGWLEISESATAPRATKVEANQLSLFG
ncbi:MAG: MBL fold metallo-hydrolase [Thermoanaerobaculia bacterium]|nr:MBL fold metallo-hydrolase [Thermoanaerobaculia bacterium]